MAIVSIHDAIMDHVVEELDEELVDFVNDETQVGIVNQGELQGNPDPDEARISITVHENDPDASYGTGDVSGMSSAWLDEVAEIEIGGTTIWKRRFTVKCRCLFVGTQENLEEAQRFSRKVRERIEDTLINMSFSGVESPTGEYVSRTVIGDEMKSEMLQAGGPPDSYDYFIKVRFDVHSTKGVFQ